MPSLQHPRRTIVAVLCFLVAAAAACAQTGGLLITQVYGGGGSTSTNPTPSFKNDFIEIFNAGTTAVDLSTYSLQYGPAGSTASPNTAFTGITVLSSAGLSGGVLAPGQYFLVQEASATNATGATLIGPDQTGSISLAVASGKVALVNGTTLLSATGSCSSTSVVSLVGYGTLGSNTCAEGGAAVNALSTTTSAIRNASCTDSGSNQADFTPGTPAPRNSWITPAPCSGTTPPVTALSISSATANPASIMPGSPTTLTVTVSPGTGSTGIAVTGDLSSVGGSAVQAFAPSATANTYMDALAATGGLAPGSYTLPVHVTDQQAGSATSSIALTVVPSTTLTPISTIQANRATYVGTTIQTRGIITLVRPGAGFYLQTASNTPGSTGDEGIYVFTGSAVPASVVVGNDVTVTGLLQQFPLLITSHAPSLEVTAPAITLNGTGNALPAPVTLPALTRNDYSQYKALESMLVKASLTVTGPTGGSLVENTETETSNGTFYAVVTGTPRPFREPGIVYREFPTATCPTVANCASTATVNNVPRPANLVLFDDNPERLIVDTTITGGPALDVSSGATLANINAVVDFTYFTDLPYDDPARLILLPNQVTSTSFTPGITVQPLPAPGAGVATVAAFNIERFFNTIGTDNKYRDPVHGTVNNIAAGNSVVVTPDAYARRLKKVSLAIRNVLNTPDVISIEEVENVSVLNDISAQIDADATAAGQTAPHYAAYGTDSQTTFTNDIGGISVGFLVKPSTVTFVSWEQRGQNDTFSPNGGAPQTLNDRPLQVLHAGLKRPNGAADYPMTLISNHLKALTGVDDAAPNTRLKKEMQAELLASLIQGYQTNGEHVLAMGDLNAFEFSDGFTDTLGTITGRLTATGVVQPGVQIVNPAATDLALTLPASARQSYVEDGNAQVLDHIIATQDIVGITQLAYAHLDADFPLVDYNDATTPARTSDHDAALAYVTLPAPVIKGTLTGSGVFSTPVAVGSSSAGQQIVFSNTGEAPIGIIAITIGSPTPTSDFAQINNCGSSLAVGGSCQINVVFKPIAGGTRTGTLVVFSSGGLFNPVTLTGTGVVPATFTLTSNGSSSTAVTVQHGFAAQIPLTLTPTSTFSGTVTLSCTGLPSNTSCDFGTSSPLNLSTGSSAQAITLLLRTSTLSANVVKADAEGPHGSTKLALAFSLPGLLLVGVGARRNRPYGTRLFLFSLLMFSLAGVLGLTGCSSNNVPNTTNTTTAAPGTYTVNVVATGASVTQTVPVTLTIQ